MKKKMNKFTSWKIGDYVLQLSVVILGIIVTFAASDAVSKYAKRKEVTKAMQIVKSELEENEQKVEEITERLRFEQKACRYFLRFEKNLEQADKDSLWMYSNTLFQIHTFMYMSDAVEMFKASSLVPHVRDKDLVVQLLKSYNHLRAVEETVKWFYDTKGEYTRKTADDENHIRREEEFAIDKDIRKICKYRLSNFQIHNLISFAAFGVAFETRCQDALDALNRTIEIIDKEYGQ